MTKKELSDKFEELKREYINLALDDAKKKFVPGVKFNTFAKETEIIKYKVHCVVVDVNSIYINDDDEVVAKCDIDWFFDKGNLKGSDFTTVEFKHESTEVVVYKLRTATLSEPYTVFDKITNSEYERELSASKKAVAANAERIEKKRIKEEKLKEDEINALKYRRQTAEVVDKWGNKIHIGDTVLFSGNGMGEAVVKDIIGDKLIFETGDRCSKYDVHKLKSREDEFTGVAEGFSEVPLTGKEWALQRAKELFDMAPNANVIVLASKCFYELTELIYWYDTRDEKYLEAMGYSSVNSALSKMKLSDDEVEEIANDIIKMSAELGHIYGETHYTSREADYCHRQHISFIILKRGSDKAIETDEV